MKFTRTILSLALAAILPFSAITAQTPDRSGPPELGPAPQLQVPPMQKLVLSNGVKVLLIEKHTVPLVQVNILFESGSTVDPTDKLGLASLTADLMDEGAGSYSALDLADAVEYIGANLSTSSGLHSSQINLNVPLAKLNEGLSLMADVLLRPTFDAAELDRKRKARITSIMQSHDQPRAISTTQSNQILFGKDHPYGRSVSGTEASLKAMTIDDIKLFHGAHYMPANAVIIVVGDVNADVVANLEQAFGDWKGEKVSFFAKLMGKGNKKPAQPVIPRVPQVANTTIYLVDKPGAAQSDIRIGRIGVDRMTPDYYALNVMNTILGGAFTSRLNSNLREEHGYSYGAGSGFSYRPAPGIFVASAAVQTEVTDKALAEFFIEFNGMLDPIPADEISKAKNYVALRLPGRFQTVSSIAGMMSEVVLFDLDDGYYNTYTSRILNLTAAEVERVAQKHVVPGAMAIVITGDRAVIEDGIRVLNLGEVINLTIEDVLGPLPTLE